MDGQIRPRYWQEYNRFCDECRKTLTVVPSYDWWLKHVHTEEVTA